jgi:hypothetical protein
LARLARVDRSSSANAGPIVTGAIKADQRMSRIRDGVAAGRRSVYRPGAARAGSRRASEARRGVARRAERARALHDGSASTTSGSRRTP